MAFADNNGVRLFYTVDGAADAPALLLSNSMGTTHEMWAPQMQALTARYRVIRYDRRGHGQSDSPAAPYTIDDLAADSVAVMDAAGVEKVHWMGLSIGGMIGLRIATIAPERINRLVVASAGVFMGPPEVWNGRIKTAQKRGIEPLAQPTMGFWFTKDFLTANPEAVDVIRAQFVQTTLDGFIGCSSAMRDMDQRESIRSVVAPTLVVVGSNDQNTSPNEAALIVGRLQNSHGLILRGSHIINVEQSTAFTEAVLKFLEG